MKIYRKLTEKFDDNRNTDLQRSVVYIDKNDCGKHVMGKALNAEERLHFCFTINASIISVKHFTCDLFHFRYLFKMRCNSLKCVIIFVVRKQVLCHYFNELSFFVVYKGIYYYLEKSCC